MLPSADPPAERADAAANRRQILVAAAGLFADGRAEDVTMAQIAERAGVGRATLYRRFANVSEVASALLDEDERDIQTRMMSGPPPLGPGADPAERMCAFYDELLGLLETHHGLVLGAEAGARRYATAAYGGWRAHAMVLLAAAGYARDLAEPLADILLAPVSADVYRQLRIEKGMDRAQIAGALHRLARSVLAG